MTSLYVISYRAVFSKIFQQHIGAFESYESMEHSVTHVFGGPTPTPVSRSNTKTFSFQVQGCSYTKATGSWALIGHAWITQAPQQGHGLCHVS